MKIGVLLAGSGVYDGSEIQEAVFTLLAIEEQGATAVCVAPNEDQLHVINHMNGEEMNEKRNVLIEAARIARGEVQDVAEVSANDFDALIIPGGFGAAKNLNQWAISGPDGPIHADVKRIIIEMLKAQKPIGGLCMGPTVIAKALEDQAASPILTVGTTEAPSPYDIQGISDGMTSIGAKAEMATVEEVIVDMKNKIVTAPCYMMEANIKQIRDNIAAAVAKVVDLAKS